MSDVVREAIDRTQVGGSGSIRPTCQTREALTGFQAVVLEADRLSDQGVIATTQKHRESWSGQRLIDAIQFQRLR